jgi:predicted hydrocarbon binding protein
MDISTKSSLYYPNRFALAMFNALIELMGRNGLNAILNYAHLPEYISQYPPDNLDKGFDYADFSAIHHALVEMYGEKGAQTFLNRAGRSTFSICICKQGALAGVDSEAFRSLLLQTKLRIGLQAIAKVISQISDQTLTVEEDEDSFRYIIRQCPECWRKHWKEKETCSYGAGLLEEGLHYISGGSEFRIIETKCMAQGDTECEYLIVKAPMSS